MSKGNKQVMMTSSFGQPFLCNIPNVDKDREKHERLMYERETAEEDTQQIIRRGLELLEPLSNECLYFHTHEYWTYEYCHKKYVRQFHIEKEQQNDATARTKTQSYYLGYYNNYAKPSMHKDASQNKPAQQSDVASPDTIDVSNTELRRVADKKYLVQRWTGGTQCDLTGKPRTVEIQYQCDMQSHDRVSLFQEITTCHYQMIISTPRLCIESMLVPHLHAQTYNIHCNPIVPDHLISDSETEEFRESEKPSHIIHQNVDADAAMEDGPSISTNAEEEGAMDAETTAITTAAATATDTSLSGTDVDLRTKDNEPHSTDSAETAQTTNDLLAMISDLTGQMRELQRQIEASQRGGAVVLEPEGEFIYINPKAEDLMQTLEEFWKSQDKQSKRDEEEDDSSSVTIELKKDEAHPASDAQQRNKKAYDQLYLALQ
ncbi:uncharacterized protein BYT42DRAFT_562370 [Radiomyces spectabilis]|uniref:uncharacterized protein n=1 Tax=Radiomyces spectabilis TaxID=64574 RepID=UPI002220C1DE|nr:uncharacterized protein BYT42DRAFT_562370 [Radiomyces spectabilis]KAI8384390.1 hypothetical protein BYT42DRAFT_562370 [Radiomyces spectabilis]